MRACACTMYCDKFPLPFSLECNGAFSHDVTAAILVFQNKETAAMLVYQTKSLGIELHFHANFCLLCYEINMAAGHVSENAL